MSPHHKSSTATIHVGERSTISTETDDIVLPTEII
jgi:hypothetical protein